jgi:hypothetical protein
MARAGETAAAPLPIAACFVDVIFESQLSDRGLAMFQRLIDDFKDSTGTALRLTSLAAAAAMALLVTTAFLCAAAFVFVLEKYGPVQACLTGAAIFFVVTLIAAGCYMVRKKQIKKQIEARAEQAAKAAKSTAQTVLSDPMLVAAGIQVIRAIGVKKLIPILAVGGLALGFLASRANGSSSASEAPAE